MIELLLGKAGAIGAGIVAVLGILAVMFRAMFKAGKDSQLAKEGKANAQTIEAIAKANAAAARANAGKLHDDDGFKRE
mgnify:CR=1 FL=1